MQKIFNHKIIDHQNLLFYNLWNFWLHINWPSFIQYGMHLKLLKITLNVLDMAVQLTGLWANYGFRMVYMWSSCTRSRGLQPDLSMSVLLRQNRDLYSWSLPCFSLIFSTHLSVSLFLLRMLYRRWRQQRRNKLMTKVWMLAIETGVAKEMALYDKIKKVQLGRKR